MPTYEAPKEERNIDLEWVISVGIEIISKKTEHVKGQHYQQALFINEMVKKNCEWSSNLIYSWKIIRWTVIFKFVEQEKYF